MAKRNKNRRKEFVVFGMGKFGASVAKALADNGCQVMAVDSEQDKVEEIAEFLNINGIKALPYHAGMDFGYWPSLYPLSISFQNLSNP